MTRFLLEILLLGLMCGHIHAQDSFELTPEAFQILAMEVGKLSKVVDQQNEVISELQEKFKIQEIVNSELKDKLNQQKRFIQDLAAKLVNQEPSPTFSSRPKTTSNTSSSHFDQKLNIRHVRQGIIRKRQNPSAVAFFARITRQSEDNLGINQNIIFEDVLTNIGNGYNNFHGVFTVPISGIYLVTSSIRSPNGQQYWAAIVVNGSDIVHLNGNGVFDRHAMGSQTAIMFLKKGDSVAVQNIVHVESVWGDRYSSFAAVLIQEYESEVVIG